MHEQVCHSHLMTKIIFIFRTGNPKEALLLQCEDDFNTFLRAINLYKYQTWPVMQLQKYPSINFPRQ